MMTFTTLKFTMLTLCAVLGSTSVLGTPIQTTKTLTACTSAELPLLSMAKGVGITGYSVSVLMLIAKEIKQPASVLAMPWARCLEKVKRGEIDLVLSAYENVERRKVYLYTRPYYTLTPQIYYRTGMKDMPVQNVETLKTLKGCGVHEYTYKHYQLDNATLDLGADDTRQMLEKLARGRCDYALDEMEYIVSGRTDGKTWPSESLFQSYQPIWAVPPKLHFLIGKDSPNGELLLKQLNTAIETLEKNGQLQTLKRKYIPAAN